MTNKGNLMPGAETPEHKLVITQVSEVDARLAAMAPELLATLENVLNQYKEGRLSSADLRAARAVIAKAKGAL